jgi:hypothetical protein
MGAAHPARGRPWPWRPQRWGRLLAAGLAVGLVAAVVPGAHADTYGGDSAMPISSEASETEGFAEAFEVPEAVDIGGDANTVRVTPLQDGEDISTGDLAADELQQPQAPLAAAEAGPEHLQQDDGATGGQGAGAQEQAGQAGQDVQDVQDVQGGDPIACVGGGCSDAPPVLGAPFAAAVGDASGGASGDASGDASGGDEDLNRSLDRAIDNLERAIMDPVRQAEIAAGWRPALILIHEELDFLERASRPESPQAQRVDALRAEVQALRALALGISSGLAGRARPPDRSQRDETGSQRDPELDDQIDRLEDAIRDPRIRTGIRRGMPEVVEAVRAELDAVERAAPPDRRRDPRVDALRADVQALQQLLLSVSLDDPAVGSVPPSKDQALSEVQAGAGFGSSQGEKESGAGTPGLTAAELDPSVPPSGTTPAREVAAGVWPSLMGALMTGGLFGLRALYGYLMLRCGPACYATSGPVVPGLPGAGVPGGLQG